MADLTIAEVLQFGANLYTLAQQKGSRLRDKVSFEDLTGEKKFFERVGTTVAVRKTGRNMDSPIIETPFTRRAIIPQDWHWGDMIDSMQKLKTLIDPTSAIVSAGGMALGRTIDDIIIEAMTGNAYSGQDGTTPVALPSTQKVAITVGNGGSGNVGLNVSKLIATKSLFGKADIDTDDPENKLYFGVSQAQVDELLAQTEIKSSDYNTIKALVEGKVSTFMGFEFVRSERFAWASNIRSCPAWCKSGVKLAMPKDITTEVAKRADKSFNWYAYASMSLASGRIEETKVVEVACAETH
jgi:hypothetical protein